MAGEHAGHRQRMRERFRAQGLDGFAPHEMLELMLFYAIPQKNVNPLAHRLLERFGSLHGVLQASVEQLMQVEGMGEYAATLLSLFAHASRQLEISRNQELPRLFTKGVALEHCRRLVDGLKQEHFYVVCLNAQLEVIRDVLIARGTLDEVQAYPREVARVVLESNAHSVILCHNHPGGSMVPSQADLDLTGILGNLLSSMNVELIDHVVVGRGMALSMMDHGLLTKDVSSGMMVTRVADPESATRIRHMLIKRAERLR